MPGRKPKQRDYDKNFGPYVRALRIIRLPYLTIERVARLIGITGPYLTKIELGKVPPPSRNAILNMASILSENPDTLLAMAGYIGGSSSPMHLTEDSLEHSTLRNSYLGTQSISLPEGQSFFTISPELLRYWSLLLTKLSEYSWRGIHLPGPKGLDHTNIISYSMFSDESPYPEIRDEVMKEFIAREDKIRGC